jgi:serine/threonine-protein kinase
VSDLPSELQNLSRFRVLRLLGAGGMGEVFLAEDKTLGRKVALKLLPEGLFSDPEVRRRFSQEARAVSALNHPQIITIYDIGAAQDRDFIAMEYVEGQTLRELLEAGPIECAGSSISFRRPRPASPPRTKRGSSIATSSPRT